MNYQGDKTTREARADGSPVVMNVSGKTVNYTRQLRVTIAQWPNGIYNPQTVKKYTEDFVTNYRTLQRVTNEINGDNKLRTDTSTVKMELWYSLLLGIIRLRKTKELYI